MALSLLLCAAVACNESRRSTPAPVEPSRDAAIAPIDAAIVDVARAHALIEKFECNRCHDGTGLARAPHEKHCVTCHRDIRAGTFAAAAKDLALWKSHIRSLLVVPSLQHAGARLRRDWVVRFLQDPIDVRPHLPASMPRLAISAEDATILAAYFVPDERADAPAPRGDLANGAGLFVDRGCPACHRFTGAQLPAPTTAAAPQAADAVALAPDLALARARLQPDRLVAWIRDPVRIDPDTLMPRLGLTEAEAWDIAAFVIGAPLAAPAPPAPETRLPVLARDVSFDEVSTRVFRKVCWHCHASPDFAFGDGGPGNTGGFGFAPRGLDLSTYEGVASGSRGDDGKRRSLFTPLPDGTPRLVAQLWARRLEERGLRADVRGMPLGLPALSREEIQLVESWIAQGRPE